MKNSLKFKKKLAERNFTNVKNAYRIGVKAFERGQYNALTK